MASTTSNGYYLEHVLDANGGTITLNAEEPFIYHRLSGTATLVSSWTVAGSNLGVGQRFVIHSEAVLTLGVNTLTILGASIPQNIANIPFTVEGIYNGSSWDTTVIPSFEGLPIISADMIESDAVTTAKILNANVTTAKILDANVTADKLASNSVITAKILDDNVTLEKLESKLLIENIVIPVSFEASEKGDNTIVLDYDGTITSVHYCVTKAIAATDDATITFDIDGSGTTPASITITASTAIDSTASTSITADNTFVAGDEIKFVTAKTTSGGKALLTIKVVRS